MKNYLIHYYDLLCAVIQRHNLYYKFCAVIRDYESARNKPQLTVNSVESYLATIKAHPIYPCIVEIKSISMLHEDILYLLRYLAICTRGRIVEFGPYIGGSTIAMALGIKKYNRNALISIEPGGSQDHPHIPSEDKFNDLVKNINKFNLSEYVELKKGFSWQDDVYKFVEQKVLNNGIGLLVIDSDGNVERDIKQYSNLLNDGCILVLDDYKSALAPEKSTLIEEWVKGGEASGQLSSLGVYGWGTWVGIFHKNIDRV